MKEPPYLTYSRYLRERHGCVVHRVAVDAGFGCPNRSGGRSAPGCTYCAEDGGRAPYLGALESVKGQVRAGLAFLKERYGAKEFILYFQAFSNTNAPVDELRSVYDAGLSLAPFRGLNVATRPDCVDEAKARLLASYQKRGLEVWVEMGLQTAHDSTLSNVRRGHTTEDFLRAYRIVKDADLKVAAHLIFGLPGEGRQEILETVDFVARLGVHGVKIHNLHIPRGTLIEREWLMGELTAPSPERHLEWVIAAIERLPATTVIMRLTCDTPDSRLSSPRHFWKKETFLSRVAREMRERGANQGNLFGSRT